MIHRRSDIPGVLYTSDPWDISRIKAWLKDFDPDAKRHYCYNSEVFGTLTLCLYDDEIRSVFNLSFTVSINDGAY